MISARILVRGEIKQGFADKLRALLNAYEGNAVEVHIASNGGRACEALAGANIIKKHGKVDVVVQNASSAATLLVAAAANRLITPNGKMLIHSASIQAAQSADSAKILAAVNNRMLNLYAERCPLPVLIQRQIHSGADYEYDAQTAVDYRLVDRVMSQFAELSTEYDYVIA